MAEESEGLSGTPGSSPFDSWSLSIGRLPKRQTQCPRGCLVWMSFLHDIFVTPMRVVTESAFYSSESLCRLQRVVITQIIPIYLVFPQGPGTVLKR